MNKKDEAVYHARLKALYYGSTTFIEKFSDPTAGMGTGLNMDTVLIGGLLKISNDMIYILGVTKFTDDRGSEESFLSVCYHPIEDKYIAYAGGFSDSVLLPWEKAKAGEEFRGFGKRRYRKLTDTEMNFVMLNRTLNRNIFLG